MIIENDPFKVVFKAFDQLYPGKLAIVRFKDTDQWNAYGVTFFPDGEKPIVWIDPDYSIRKATEVLIHELAHVAVGHDAGHGERFLEAQERITAKYNELK